MDREDRRFWSWLLLISGPLMQAGGWAAAFTSIGAAFVFVGTGMSLAAFPIWPRAWSLAGGLIGAAIGGWGWLLALWLL